jgi:hypothetical protein
MSAAAIATVRLFLFISFASVSHSFSLSRLAIYIGIIHVRLRLMYNPMGNRSTDRASFYKLIFGRRIVYKLRFQDEY